MLKGGSSGPAVVAGEPDKSLLIKAVRHTGALHMPPAKQLPPEQAAILTRWVAMGLPWPGAASLPRPLAAAPSPRRNGASGRSSPSPTHRCRTSRMAPGR